MKKITYQEMGRPDEQAYSEMEKMPIVVVLENIRSMNNVGSFFRTCDAFAVEKIYLCGITGRPPSREIHKTALGAENTVRWDYSESTISVLEKLRDRGYIICAVEQVSDAVLLGNFRPDPDKRYALIFGNEVEGVSDKALELCEAGIEIPQAGTKHSLNVSVAGGVVLWHFFCSYLR